MANETLDPLLQAEPPLADVPMSIRLHQDVSDWVDALAEKTEKEKASIVRELMRRGWMATVSGQAA